MSSHATDLVYANSSSSSSSSLPSLAVNAISDVVWHLSDYVCNLHTLTTMNALRKTKPTTCGTCLRECDSISLRHLVSSASSVFDVIILKVFSGSAMRFLTVCYPSCVFIDPLVPFCHCARGRLGTYGRILLSV